MAKFPYLVRSGRRGLLHFRRSAPRLRQLMGKREILVAFGTAELSQVLPRYHVVAASVEKDLELAHAELDWREEEAAVEADGGFTDMTAMVAAGAHLGPQEQCRLHYERCKAREWAFRRETTRRVKACPAAFWRGDLIELPMAREEFHRLPLFSSLHGRDEGVGYLLAAAYRARLETRLLLLQSMLANHDFEALGATLSCCPECAERMGLAFARVEIQLIEQLLSDDAALLPSVVDTKSVVSQSAASQPSPSQPTSWRSAALASAPQLSSAVAAWSEAGARGRAAWSEERRQLCRRVMADFIDICGDKPLDAYKKSDGREFVRLLRRLPANLDKRLTRLEVASRDLRKLAAAAEQQRLAPQDDSNVNKKIGVVQQCFRWIMMHYDECTASPVEGMKIPVRRSAREEKDPFAVDQLNRMFQAPVFTGCASEARWSRPGAQVLRASAKFWVPLIALFTGMRSGEICQLTRAKVCEHQGIHYFALTRDMRLKNSASIRSVPIHPMLLDCGLLAFVASCDDELFPDLPRHRSGRLSDGFGKHFARFLRALDIKTDRLDLHSFRHTFIAAAESSGMDFAARERIVGHALQGQAGRYGKSYEHEQRDMQLLAARYAQLRKLKFPGLELDHLRQRIRIG